MAATLMNSFHNNQKNTDKTKGTPFSWIHKYNTVKKEPQINEIKERNRNKERLKKRIGEVYHFFLISLPDEISRTILQKE